MTTARGGSYRTRLGREGEAYARGLLESEGYRVLSTNFSTRYGEIDIVAEEGEYVCFVEVRLTTGPGHGSPEESIGARKRSRLVRAARGYLHEHGWHDRACRFDVLGVRGDPGGGPPLGHVLIRDAFWADD